MSFLRDLFSKKAAPAETDQPITISVALVGGDSKYKSKCFEILTEQSSAENTHAVFTHGKATLKVERMHRHRHDPVENPASLAHVVLICTEDKGAFRERKALEENRLPKGIAILALTDHPEVIGEAAQVINLRLARGDYLSDLVKVGREAVKATELERELSRSRGYGTGRY